MTAKKDGGALGRKPKFNLLTMILLGLIMGAAVGSILAATASEATIASFVNSTKFFGDIFIRLLKMIVVPVIFLSLVTGAASIEPSKLGRVGLKTLVFYLATSIVAVFIGLLLANIFTPGLGFNVIGDPNLAGKAAAGMSLSQIFLNIVPTNPVESLAKGDVLPIIFFSLVFGISLALVRESSNKEASRWAEGLYQLFSVAAETMYKVVSGIMHYAPIGVFVLIAIVFAQQGAKAVGTLLFVTLTVYIGLILHSLICYGGLIKLFGLSFRKFIAGCYEASVTAFVTRSSSGTLPVTMRVTEEKMGVPRSISSFTLPIGATVNMDGTAIYLAVCAMFIGYATGNPLDTGQQLTVLITATLAAIGTAGVPGAGAIMLLMVLESVGLNVVDGSAVAAAYAMVLGIDALLDMGRTSINVTGDMVGAVLISKNENALDISKWK